MADRVVFLRPDAERIARVVRRVEGMREGSPLTFGPVLESSQRKVFRICTFAGAWATGSTKTVTFKYQSATPNTVNALNLFFPITDTAAAADCAVAKEGTAWYLIDIPFQTATISVVQATASGFYAQSTAVGMVAQSTSLITFSSGSGSSATFVSGISVSAVLNTDDCTITVSQTVSTGSVTIAGATATARVIGATATAVSISGVATALFVTQTATAAVLTFKVT